MKALVAYFTRTGNTEKVARAVAGELPAELERITDNRDHSGVLGYLKAGRDAMRKESFPIGEPKHPPADYDLVIVGTPVWAYTMTPAVRTYLSSYAKGTGTTRKAYFCTHGGNPGHTIPDMEQVGGSAAAALTLRDKKVKRDEFSDELSRFLKELRG